MEKHFALIKNGIVEGVILADDIFINNIKEKYDLILDVTNINRPATGDSYYVKTNTFVSNTEDIVHVPVDMSGKHMQNGTEIGFKPFKISKYSVTWEDGMVVIGCKKYSAPGFFDALHKIFIEKQDTISHFTTINGPAHGKFGITWDDVQKLYDVLKKVKF
jgi:hypothetical protein